MIPNKLTILKVSPVQQKETGIPAGNSDLVKQLPLI
jgi:hypothetical protein